MPVFINKEPDQCFNPTSCAVFEFESDSAVKNNGSREPVIIPLITIGISVQVGTVININGNIFTVVASGGSLADNEINFDIDDNVLVDNIDTAIANNFRILKDYEVAQDVDGNLVLQPRNANTVTYIVISNAVGFAREIIIEGQSNPVCLKDMYSIIACFSFLNPVDGTEEFVEVDFFPTLTVSDDGTTPSNAILTRNIGCFFEPYFDCPIPALSYAGGDVEIFQTSGLTLDSKVMFSEKYNGSTFLNNELQVRRFFHADVCDEEIDCHYPLGIEPGQEICITCNQYYWIHRYIPLGATADVEYFVSSYDSRGNLISNGSIDSNPINESMLYMPVGLQQLRQEFILAQGLTESQINNISSITVAILLNYGGSERQHFISIDIVDQHESINLIYKNRFNLYQGIALNVPSSRSYNTVLNYIETCGLCRKQRRVVSKDQYESCTVSFIPDLCLQEKDISDFLKSDSILIVDDEGNTFPVVIDGQDVVFENKGSMVSQPFTIKIYPC